MARKPLSVTLETDNVAWLKGRAGAIGESVSELLDQIVAAARQDRHAGPVRSVTGSIDIDPSDPLLERADDLVRTTFERSLGRPFLVRESRPAVPSPRKRSRKRRG